jgi:hypothetical protein
MEGRRKNGHHDGVNSLAEEWVGYGRLMVTKAPAVCIRP